MADTPFYPAPGGAGTGAAFILRNDNTALNILRQGEAARQRAAQLAEAARQKQLTQDAKDYLDASKFNLEGGRIFQNGLTKVVAPEAQQQIMQVYQDRTLTPMQRSMKARDIQNAYEGERQMTLQKQSFIDDFLKQKDDELNRDNIAIDLAAAARNPDGSLLRASQFDEEGVTNGILAKAANYNAPVVVQNAIKGIQPAITEAVANAGKIGGTRTAATTTARFFDVDPATGQVKRNSDGSAILNITDDSLALLKQNKRFSLLLQDRIAQNPDLDEKKAAADLIGPYATYKETQTATRNAQPSKGRAGAGAKFAVLGGQPTQGFTVYGGQNANGQQVVDPTNISMAGFFAGNAPGTREGVTSQFGGYGDLPAPAYVSATNPNGKPFNLKGIRTRRLFLPDDNGTLRWVNNNDQPIYGEAQNGIAILRNPKTGEYKLAPSEEGAAKREAQKLLNEGWVMGTGVSVAIPKNKNYAADYTNTLRRLQAANNGSEDERLSFLGTSRKFTVDELEDKARELTAGATAQAIIPYDEETAGSIDNQTLASYRPFHQSQGQRAKALKTTAAAPSKTTAGRGPLAPLMGKNGQTAAPNPSKYRKTKK